MAPETSRTKVKSVWLGLYDTPDERGWYPISNQSRFNQLFVFTRKSTQGDATKDSDDFISTWIISDLSGGGQVEDYNEGAEGNRYWSSYGVDARSPGIITLAQLVTPARPNSNCSSCWPLEVGNDSVAYDAFNESGTWEVWGFNETTNAYDYNSGAGVALGAPPTGKAVRFDGVIYAPTGTLSGGGYARVTGSTGVPTVAHVSGSADPTTAAPVTTPRPVAFTVYDGKLWALTAEGGLAHHSIAQKTAGSNEWSWPYGDTTTDFPQIDASATPYALIIFPDKNGVESIYAKTSRGVYIFDENHPRWVFTDIIFPPHPDINRAMAVWRPGERLHLGVGLDDYAYTAANTIVPFSGLVRDHGLPQEERGAIIDLEAEVGNLYAAVSPGTFSVHQYSAKIAADGTGNGEFNTPKGLAWNSTNSRLYVCDFGNDRVQLLDSTPAYQGQFAVPDTPYGIAADNTSGKVYVAGGQDVLVIRYSAAGVQDDALIDDDVLDARAVAVNQTSRDVYIADYASNIIRAYGESGFGSLGSEERTAMWTMEGTNPVGLAINSTTGEVYVIAQGEDRIEHYTSDGTLIGAWGGSGSNDGQFQLPSAIAVHPLTGDVYVADSTRGDIQQFTELGAHLHTIGSTGSGDGQFAAIGGLAFDPTGILYVSDTQSGDDRVQKFTLQEVEGFGTLHAWTGIGWHGLYRFPQGTAPTVMKVAAATGGYTLRVGGDDGYCYRIDLRRSLHNPRQGFLSGLEHFQASGVLVTGWFDAAMSSFGKIASHLVIAMDNATARESVSVEYAVDGGPWEELGEVTRPGETVLEFNVSSGFSRGRRFNRIRFRFTLARGSTTTLTPVMESAVLAFQKVPQNTVAHTLEIPLHRKHGDRTPAEMYEDLTQLVTAGEMLKLVIGKDATASDGTNSSAVKRVLPATISGLMDGGVTNTRHVTLGVIEVRATAGS